MAYQIKIYQVLLTNIEVSCENRQCFYQCRSSLIAINGIFLRILNYLQGTVAVASESQFFYFFRHSFGQDHVAYFQSLPFEICQPFVLLFVCKY
jgi:hypothetical protein